MSIATKMAATQQLGVDLWATHEVSDKPGKKMGIRLLSKKVFFVVLKEGEDH